MKLATGTKTDEQMLFDYPRRARAKDWFVRVRSRQGATWLPPAIGGAARSRIRVRKRNLSG
jgi:hypothetical protein